MLVSAPKHVCIFLNTFVLNEITTTKLTENTLLYILYCKLVPEKQNKKDSMDPTAILIGYLAMGIMT